MGAVRHTRCVRVNFELNGFRRMTKLDAIEFMVRIPWNNPKYLVLSIMLKNLNGVLSTALRQVTEISLHCITIYSLWAKKNKYY